MKRQLVCLFLCVFLLTIAVGEITAAKKKIIMWDVQTTTKLKEKIDQAVKEFNKDNPKYQLEVVHIQNDPFKTKLKVVMGAGNPPDIFHNWGGGGLKEYIDSGMVAPIDSIKNDLLKRYIPAAFDPATFNGKTYGSPYGGLTGVFFWYRKDIFAKYNLSPPKTWKEFLQVCETLKNNGIIPITLANKTKWPGSFFYMYLADRAGGANMFKNALYNRKKGGSFDTPGYVKAGELLQELVKKGYFPKGFNGMEQDTGQSRVLLYTGKAAMYLMGNWFISNAKKENPGILEYIDFFSFPAVDGGKGDPTNLIGSPGQNYFSIPSTSKNKKIAMKFLKEYIMDQSYIEFISKNGYVAPVKNSASYISDPMMKKIAKSFEAAGHVQLYYDQFLSPEMARKHLDLVQALFGLSITPEEVAKQHEKAMAAEMKK